VPRPRPGSGTAELDEARAEIGIQDVEVVDGHGPVGLLEAEVDRLAVGVLAPLVAHEELLDLLGNHDRHHPVAALTLGLLQVGADVVELAIVPAGAVGPLEAQQGDAPLLGEGRDRLAEAVADAFEQDRRGDLVAQVLGQEPDHLAADLQVRDVGVEVDAVQAIQVERDVAVQDVVDVHHRRHMDHPIREASLGLPSASTKPTARDHPVGFSAVRGGPHWCLVRQRLPC
jgi:hypothetical protein